MRKLRVTIVNKTSFVKGAKVVKQRRVNTILKKFVIGIFDSSMVSEAKDGLNVPLAKQNALLSIIDHPVVATTPASAIHSVRECYPGLNKKEYKLYAIQEPNTPIWEYKHA